MSQVKPENPLEKRIYGVRHFLHGIGTTQDGVAHEGLITVMADMLEMLEMLSVRSVNQEQQVKDLRLTGDRVIVDPMYQKDLQLALDEIRGQITLHEAKHLEKDQPLMSRIKTDPDQLLKDLKECGHKEPLTSGVNDFIPNHFQRLVDLYSHTNAVFATHRRVGKTVQAAKSAADYALTHPGSTVLIVSPKVHVEYEILRFVGKKNIDSASKWPMDYTLINGSRILVRYGGTNKGTTVRGIAAERVILDEAEFVNEAVIRDLEPIIAGSCCVTTAFFTPLPRYEDQAFFLKNIWKNPRFTPVHYPVTLNPDYAKDKVFEIRETSSQEQWASEWLAIVPEEPKAPHTCNCKKGGR